MKKKLFVFGIRNFAEMAHYLFKSDSDYEVAGFTVDGPFMEGDTFKGLPVVAYEELRSKPRREDVEIFVAIGISKLNKLRAQKTAQVAGDGFRLASFVSSHSQVPDDLVIRPNTMIMEQVTVGPGTHIGSDTIIWSGSRIALKAQIGNHVWITSAAVGDSTTIGDYTFIGIHATVSSFVNVGTCNLIGAAAVIMRNTKDYEVYKGNRSTPSKASSERIENLDLIR